MTALPLAERRPSPASAVRTPFLRVESLNVSYDTDAGQTTALDDVCFSLNAGKKRSAWSASLDQARAP